MSTAPGCPKDAYGWLSPSGKYHEVDDAHHDDYMYNELGMDTSAAEELGWIHLCSGNYQHYGEGLCSRLTPEQRRWLVKVGFELEKGDEE